MTLYLMRGLSGSGKTTYAKTLDAVRVSRDDIRAELTGRSDKFAGDNKFEAQVTRVQKERVRDALIARRDVVIDDTNLIDKFAVEWLNMAHDYGHDWAVHEMDATLEEAITQNANREDSVPEDVIRKQWSKWVNIGEIHPTHPFVDWSPYEPNHDLPIAVGVDLDGTLCLNETGMSPYDSAHYPLDTPNRSVQYVLEGLLRQQFAILALTGRDAQHRNSTLDWLYKHALVHELHMRKAGDRRRDDVVKAEMFNENVRGRYNFALMLDDRQRVVDMWRARGIQCFQVAGGSF